jgi:putative intracellular protease/amidase
MTASTAPSGSGTQDGVSSPQSSDGPIPNLVGNETIAMLLYPGFTALDLVGPHYFFACLQGATVHLVTNQDTLSPVVSDLHLAITPSARLIDVPQGLDVIFVPGGSQGTLAAMEHEPTLAFLRSHAAAARLTTSVCTGSFILAAAGLLKGKRATSHWLARDGLAAFGAFPVDRRTVRDGETITGAGVSAGLDMALTVVEALRGRPYAAALMLQAEYSPEPPFRGGRPETTEPSIVETLLSRSQFKARAEAIARLMQ